jgi:hypothetical protein
MDREENSLQVGNRFYLKVSNICCFPRSQRQTQTNTTINMADAADGKLKDLKISETKKSKKDGAPKTAGKKPQQQKKKVGLSTDPGT